MKRIISYCLYGDDPLYIEGMRRNVLLQTSIYPGWITRVYTDLDVDLGVPCEIVRMGPHKGSNLMFARFLAAADPEARYVIFRDADSRINHREHAAVMDWIASGKSFHVMRDHPDHANWPVLGGMWGCKGMAIPNIADLIAKWPSHTNKLDDMRFLAETLWPTIKNDMKHHSSVPTEHPGAEPFPKHRPYDGFCGEIIQP